MDCTLIGLEIKYRFLNDNLIVSKGSEEKKYKQVVINCLKSFNEENLRTDLHNGHFAILENDWLVYHFSQLGISPI